MNHHRSQTQHLPREYKKALSKLLAIMNTSQRVLKAHLDNSMYEGKLQFIQNSFSLKMIPSSGNWRWNQRKTVPVPGGQVTFFKLSPRKLHPDDAPVPSYKLWKFCIRVKDSGIFYCLWCEKGPAKAAIPVKLNTSPDVSLEDLRFLASFMNPNVVSELWPSE